MALIFVSQVSSLFSRGLDLIFLNFFLKLICILLLICLNRSIAKEIRILIVQVMSEKDLTMAPILDSTHAQSKAHARGPNPPNSILVHKDTW